MNSIPLDLFHEIFSRLPIKSIGRCRCVSKLWESILCRQDFTELVLTRSSARPRLLFAMKGFRSCSSHFFSSPRPHSPYDEKWSSLVVAAHSHIKFPGDLGLFFCGYASGLMCFRPTSVNRSSEDEDTLLVICNPSTGQRTSLPELRNEVSYSSSFLGFDPIDKQFKVLVIARNDGYRILTLGTEKMSWREIQCPSTHHPHSSSRICINGVLYYFLGLKETPYHHEKIACFDVRSKKFIKFMDAGYGFSKLICNKGKLCVIIWKSISESDDTLKLHVWILEDLEKQEWSEHGYILPDHNQLITCLHVDVVGVTAIGEIVFSDRYIRKPFHVYYLNPERNALQIFEIKGTQVGNNDQVVRVFLDPVEDFRFNFRKKTSYSKAKLQRDRLRFEGINKVDVLCLSDDD